MSDKPMDRVTPEYLNGVADLLAKAKPDKHGFVTMRPSSRDLLVSDLRRAASALAAPDDRVARLEEALRGVRDWLRSAPLESGYCCCGSPVDGHGIGDGHSPVDELSYSAAGQIEMIDAALADGPDHAG